MKPLRFALLLAVVTAVTARAQEAPTSALQPDRVYTATVTRTLGGNDGTRDVPPTVSEQRIVITTGAHRDGAVLVEVQASLPQKPGAEDAASGTTYRFTLADDGAIRDVQATNPELAGSPELTFRMLSRVLEDALFRTPYALAPSTGLKVRVTQVTASAAGQNVDFTVEDSRAESASGQPIVTTTNGTAEYNAAQTCYLRRTQSEESRFFVPGDEKNAAKDVVMRRDLVVEVRVAPLSH